MQAGVFEQIARLRAIVRCLDKPHLEPTRRSATVHAQSQSERDSHQIVPTTLEVKSREWLQVSSRARSDDYGPSGGKVAWRYGSPAAYCSHHAPRDEPE